MAINIRVGGDHFLLPSFPEIKKKKKELTEFMEIGKIYRIHFKHRSDACSVTVEISNFSLKKMIQN